MVMYMSYMLIVFEKSAIIAAIFTAGEAKTPANAKSIKDFS